LFPARFYRKFWDDFGSFTGIVVVKGVCLQVLIAWFACYGQAIAQVYPPGFAEVQVTNGIVNPTALAFTPDGRIFVCEQTGKVRVVKNGTLLPASFVQVPVNSNGERGLIGIAIDPDFDTNHYVYIYYTVNTAPLHNRISRFTGNGDIALSGSDTLILELDNLTAATNHNGGAMHFGADGKLYVAIGENANGSNAQSMDTYHGKFLRINKDGSIPEGNPFSDGSDKKKRFWAYGLRNPYTFSVQPETGRIFVNDVGQSMWEEINDATTGGLNFGWPAEEGIPDNPGSEIPVFTYSHGTGDGKGCAITGGTFFNPESTSYPGEYYNNYFFQDFCNGWINFIDVSSDAPANAPFATGLGPSCLGLTTGNDGNLYYLSRPDKALYKIVYSMPTAPFITSQPAPVTSTEEQETVFEVKAIGSTPLQYQWYKDGNAIEDATESVITIVDTQPADAGEYKVVVTNATGSAESSGAALTVVDVNDPPLAVITSPEHLSTYTAGTFISFSGTATDEEDGELTAGAFSWDITFRSGEQIHGQASIPGTMSGEFPILDEGVTSDNVLHRVVLTVVDSDGLKAKDSIDILPRKSTITLQTEPEGLQLLLDDQPFPAPASVVSVQGMKRRIGAVSPQVVDEITYSFDQWLHGGDDSQTIVTPRQDTTFTAMFSIVLSAEEASSQHGVTVFPNPVLSGSRYTEVSMASQKAQPVTIYLVDLLSRRIGKVEDVLVVGENSVPIDVEMLSNGLYGLVVETADLKKTVKLLVNR
jgi:glucose/arabinose dehydrogenase